LSRAKWGVDLSVDARVEESIFLGGRGEAPRALEECVGILAILRERRNEIVDLAQRRRATNLRIYGSVARGDDTEASDVDLLADFAEGATLLDLIGLEQELTELVGRDVHVTTERALTPKVRERIHGETIPL
jgi:uncharacterized protein